MKWLHISDLHYNPRGQKFDTNQLLLKMNEYFDKHGIAVDEIFYTGDFRYAKTQEATLENARLAAGKLKDIASHVGVTDTSHIHIVPGNHDLERGEAFLLEQAYSQYGDGEFSGFVKHNRKQVSCADYLSSRFQFFLLVASELNNKIWLNAPTGGCPSCHRSDKIGKQFKIVYLNTALGCGRDDERTKLCAGYEYISQAMGSIDSSLPTIVLGHHGLGCFARKEKEQILEIFNQHKVRLYLCGDEHVGGFDEFNPLLQLTAGCLNRDERGVDPTFYIGDMENDGSFNMKAYAYKSGAYPGWMLDEPLCDRIGNWTNKAFPLQESSVSPLCKNDEYDEY